MKKLVQTALLVHGLGIVLLLTGCSTVGGWFQSEDEGGHGTLPLAVSGQALAVIVIPEAAPPPVRFAAKELQIHLQTMTGSTFPVQEGGALPDTMAILLGETLAAGAEIELDDVPRDGYRIVTDGAYIYIAGHDDASLASQVLFMATDGPLPPSATARDREQAYGAAAWDFERGTLHGVYAFLEQLGVRWLMPGDLGTIIPERTTIQVRQQDTLGQPHFQLRQVGDIVIPGQHGFSPADPTRFAELGWDGRAQRLWMVRQRLSSRPLPIDDRVNAHEWAPRFASSRPDFFALQPDGTRLDQPGAAQLNYGSTGVFRNTLLDVLAYATGESGQQRRLSGDWPVSATWSQTFSLTPASGFRGDHSPESLMQFDPEAPYPGRHSDYVWGFVSRVAQEVGPRHAGYRLTCLARESYLLPPDNVKQLPPNLLVGVGLPASAASLHQTADRRAYKQLSHLVEEWRDISPQPLLLDWSWSFRRDRPLYQGVPMLVPQLAGQLMADHAEYAGWARLAYDLEEPVLIHLDRYIMARLLWDPTQSVEAILEDYARSFYGPAAPLMMNMLQDIEAHCQVIAEDHLGLAAIWEDHFDSATMQRYRNWLIEAKVVAAGTPYAEKVAMMERHWLGAMDASRNRYLQQIKSVRQLGQDRLPASSIGEAGISVDGRFGDPAWKLAEPEPFYRSDSGARLALRGTYAKLVVDEDNLYVAVATDQSPPLAMTLLMGQPELDFLYHSQLDRAGHVQEGIYWAAGQPLDRQWTSNVWARVETIEDSWQAELALPRRSMAGWSKLGKPMPMLITLEWGDPTQHASTSPMMRGGTIQPEAFNRLVLVP